jgi:hypothetical protein
MLTHKLTSPSNVVNCAMLIIYIKIYDHLQNQIEVSERKCNKKISMFANLHVFTYLWRAVYIHLILYNVSACFRLLRQSLREPYSVDIVDTSTVHNGPVVIAHNHPCVVRVMIRSVQSLIRVVRSLECQ